MKIEVNEDREIVLKEVFSGVLLTQPDGNSIGICMRDGTFDINVIPLNTPSQWFSVDMQSVDIKVTS